MAATDSSIHEIWFGDLTDRAQRHLVNWYRRWDPRYKHKSFTDVHEEFSHGTEPLATIWPEDVVRID